MLCFRKSCSDECEGFAFRLFGLAFGLDGHDHSVLHTHCRVEPVNIGKPRFGVISVKKILEDSGLQKRFHVERSHHYVGINNPHLRLIRTVKLKEKQLHSHDAKVQLPHCLIEPCGCQNQPLSSLQVQF